MTDNEKLDLILGEIGTMKSDICAMKSDIGSMKSNMGSMQSNMGSMQSNMGSMQSNMGSMQSNIELLNDKLTEVQLTLENETNKNIKIIAEGHLDLSRKLDDSLKVNSEKEMMLVRITTLENEVRRLKDRIERTA